VSEIEGLRRSLSTGFAPLKLQERRSRQAFKVLFIIEQPAQQFTCHAELSGSMVESQPFLVTNIF